jgi:hypothetical protein
VCVWPATVDRMHPIGGHSLVQKRQNFEPHAKDYFKFFHGLTSADTFGAGSRIDPINPINFGSGKL